jgi:hypothetical protein
MLMKVDMTPPLRKARARRCRIEPRREMLSEQAPLYPEFFSLGTVAAGKPRPDV